MEKIMTKAGDYTIYLGAEAPRRPDEHEPDKWYYEPGDYVGFTVFSDPHDSVEQFVTSRSMAPSSSSSQMIHSLLLQEQPHLIHELGRIVERDVMIAV